MTVSIQFETADGTLLCTTRDTGIPRVGDELYLSPLEPRRWIVTRIVWNIMVMSPPLAFCDAVSVICEPKAEAA